MPAQDFFKSAQSATGKEILLFPNELVFKDVAQQLPWRYGKFRGDGGKLIINEVQVAFLRTREPSSLKVSSPSQNLAFISSPVLSAAAELSDDESFSICRR